MGKYPNDLKYSKEHEWVRVAGTQATLGITDYAQRQLGDVVFVELPKVGASFEQGRPIGNVESVKSVAEVYAPISGQISEVNDDLNDSPELVNDDPFGEGWLVKFKIKDSKQLAGLMTADQYEQFLAEAES
ncbi:glycine cleavage system protein GcvH [Ktedonosporobacter rubrisoli]|uniref:Glycine cleavage system H protein n=1 Tax=Ktedonosporobacter rubrisoli TaxID=2509675 RepID=A0A4P6JJ77_KTERU|nr:glycine cleavage system protein GcvH [Ktedonosporobacter rubrisoli]QBD74716.1 glycine cleavage system protein GcvH [Ktedonosporobacter rubrisoli]